MSEEWKEMLSFILAVVNPNLLQEPDGFQTVNFLIKDKLMVCTYTFYFTFVFDFVMRVSMECH